MSNSTNDMTQHINVKHAVDESFVYPNSSEELECPECGKSFLADHNYACHAYEEHFYGFDCFHCHKHFPGDDLMYCIHMKISRVSVWKFIRGHMRQQGACVLQPLKEKEKPFPLA